MSQTYFVGLGSNLRQRARNIRHALNQVSKQVGRIEDTSYLYETPPMYQKDQPKYLNAVARISTDLSPHETLDRLLAIELQMGRVRHPGGSSISSSSSSNTRYGPRIIDLDLLCGGTSASMMGYSSHISGSVQIKDSKLELPHPRMLERNFVVAPMSDLLPSDVVTVPIHKNNYSHGYGNEHNMHMIGDYKSKNERSSGLLFGWKKKKSNQNHIDDAKNEREISLRELSAEFQANNQPIQQVTPLLYGLGMRGIGGSSSIVDQTESEVLHPLSQGSIRNTGLMAVLNLTDDSFSKDGWFRRQSINHDNNMDYDHECNEQVLASTFTDSVSMKSEQREDLMSVRERIERMMNQNRMEDKRDETNDDCLPPSLDLSLILDCVSKWVDQSSSKMVQILDVGGQSTRPGARVLSAQEEMDRVCRVIEELRRSFPTMPISIDTFYPSVARECVLNGGASMVNDISFANPSAWMNDDKFDYNNNNDDMIAVMAELGVPYILTHSTGRMNKPMMNDEGNYPIGVVSSIQREMQDRVSKLIQAGVFRWNIICDPGIGFNKTADESNVLISNMHRLKPEPKMPILSGPSRKSCLKNGLRRAFGDSKELDDASNESRKIATAAAVNESIMSGCDFVRVHDVPMMSLVRHTADEINSQRIRHDALQPLSQSEGTQEMSAKHLTD